MKTTVLSFFVLLGTIVSTSVNATKNPNIHVILTDTTSGADIPDAFQLLQEIIHVTGLQQNFELKAAEVRNIEASIQNKKRYILYNPTFLHQINQVTKSKWAAATLIAHEVGHHLNGHTLKRSGSNIKVELEADEFAGFILHKMGATLQQAQEVMKYIASQKDSKTHPNKTSRMKAIENGWNRAS